MKVYIILNQDDGLITKTFAYKNEAIRFMDLKNEEYTKHSLQTYKTHYDVCPEEPYTIVEQDVC
jgi:hypothetical protein